MTGYYSVRGLIEKEAEGTLSWQDGTRAVDTGEQKDLQPSGCRCSLYNPGILFLLFKLVDTNAYMACLEVILLQKSQHMLIAPKKDNIDGDSTFPSGHPGSELKYVARLSYECAEN